MCFNGDIYVQNVLRGTIYLYLVRNRFIKGEIVRFIYKYTHVAKCMQLPITQAKK